MLHGACGKGAQMIKLCFTAALAGLLFHASAESQVAQPSLTYADLADLALPAPVAAHVRVTRAVRLKGDNAANVAAGMTRFYVEADIVSLIKGPSGLPAKVSYLVDLPRDAAGKPARMVKKSEYLLTAETVAGRPGELRLAAPDAQIPWTIAAGDRVRQLLNEAQRSDAPPRITGIGRAFHVAGTLPGESETQIFLQTAEQRPVSLSILRRPGEQPHWSVALSEIVDDGAAAPRKDTLLWYRLACTLPQTLPRQTFAGAEADEVSAIQADYRLVLHQLGPCARNRAGS